MNTFKKTNYLANLNYSATGRSAEGKEFTARAQSLFFPGKLLTGIRVGYYQNLKKQVNAELALVDFQGKPASGEIRVTLYQEYYEKHQRKLKKVSGPEDFISTRPKPTHSACQRLAIMFCAATLPTPDGRSRFDFGRISSPGTAAIPSRPTG